MVLRRRDQNGGDRARPTYSGLGSRLDELLRMAEQQRDQIIAEARHEAAVIVGEARRQAEEILANASAQAVRLAGGGITEPGAGQEQPPGPGSGRPEPGGVADPGG